MSKKEIITNFNKLRTASIKNAEDLLRGAKLLLDAGIDHAAFHMSALALEEIGKIEMEVIRAMSLIHPRPEPISYSFDIDDHQRKLFWALWGPSFGMSKQTKDLIDKNKDFAKKIHEKRLRYLYVDPGNPTHWSELMNKGEAKNIYDLVYACLKLQKASKEGLTEQHLDKSDELDWFMRTQDDEQKRKEIWGHKSQEKLIELGDVKEWIKWLRETYLNHEEDLQKIAKKELARKQPPEAERLDPKWRVTIEIITPSHSIRQNQLLKFNENIDWISLIKKDNHTLKLVLTLSKNVPVQGLWDYAWGMSRMFVAALNIATNGFFWWNIKIDTSRFYEEIWDLENDAGIKMEINPRLQVSWKEKRLVLREVDLSIVSIVFSYIADCHFEKNEEHLNRYVAGLSLLAKSDIHLRLEMNAFEEFFSALKVAMILNKDWDQEKPFEIAYHEATKWRFPELTGDMKKYFPMAFKVEKEHKGPVDLTAVYSMKNYCEIYFQTLAIRCLEEKEGGKVSFELERDPDSQNSESGGASE